jgi:hypothetical protein
MEFAEDADSGKTARLLMAYSLHPDSTRLGFEPGADLRNDLGEPFQLPLLRPAALLYFAQGASKPQLAVVGVLG